MRIVLRLVFTLSWCMVWVAGMYYVFSIKPDTLGYWIGVLVGFVSILIVRDIKKRRKYRKMHGLSVENYGVYIQFSK